MSAAKRDDAMVAVEKDIASPDKAAKVQAGIFSPTPDENFYVPKDTQKLLDIIHEMAQEEGPQNVLVVGPQGCGKTDLGLWFAAKKKMPTIMLNCAMIRETKDWMGWRAVEDGSVFWQKSGFVRAVEKGGVCVIMDEFNRLHSTLHNAIYPLLDHRRRSFIEELQETIAVGPGTIFFGTVNIGLTHVGTYIMDSSMEDRWGIRIDVGFLDTPKEIEVLVAKTGVDESTAKKLVQLANDIRKRATGDKASFTRAISTRQLLITSRLMKRFKKAGIKISAALEYTITPFYSKEGGKDSEQAQLLQVIQGIFGADG